MVSALSMNSDLRDKHAARAFKLSVTVRSLRKHTRGGLEHGSGPACFSCINWMDADGASGLVAGPNRPCAGNAQCGAA
jgi:hypothetical protein